MNDIITIDAADQPSTALTVIRSALPTILAADQNDILGKLAEEIAAFVPDVSTERGRKKIASLAAKVASSKMDLIRLGKGLTEGWRNSTAAVNAECHVIEDRMDALKRRVRQPLDEFEAAHAARIEANETAIAALEVLVDGLGDLTTAEIKERYQRAGIVAEFEWSVEFIARAQRIQNGVIAQLEVAYTRAKQREADAAAELVRLEQEAETARLAAIQAQQDREAQIARDAAEAARIEAESKAAAAAQEAAAGAQRALEAEQAKVLHEQEIARQVAARAEIARTEAHQRALDTMQKLATPLEHPDPLPVIDAKRSQLDDVYSRDWEEHAEVAASVYALCCETLDAARVESTRLAAERAERDRAAAIERERIVEERAEINRQAEAARAEREKVAAVDAERKRVADAVAAELAAAERRAADRDHRAKINGAVLDGMMEAIGTVHAWTAGEAGQIAMAIIKAIAKGAVPHVSIGY